jgi:monomeric sarcosine oxidase
MGASTARALAREGKRVVLLEQYEIGHKRGSSHGASRVFRFAYPDPMYVAMAQASLHLWRELEQDVVEDLLITTGGLDAGSKVEGIAEALAECGAAHELIDGAEANRRWGFLSFPADEPVLFQPDAGITRADRSVAAFVKSAVEAGADVHEHTSVIGLEESNGGVRVATAEGDFRAKVAVVTAGAWAKELLRDAGIDLDVTPTRETIAYFSMPERPPTFVDWQDPTAFALWDPNHGLKAGLHHAGPLTDPNEDIGPEDESVKRIAAWVAVHYPTADPTPVAAETCIYTNTSDESFVVERHGPIVVGSPCSGHGFKFAPLIGRRLAELATEV